MAEFKVSKSSCHRLAIPICCYRLAAPHLAKSKTSMASMMHRMIQYQSVDHIAVTIAVVISNILVIINQLLQQQQTIIAVVAVATLITTIIATIIQLATALVIITLVFVPQQIQQIARLVACVQRLRLWILNQHQKHIPLSINLMIGF